MRYLAGLAILGLAFSTPQVAHAAAAKSAANASAQVSTPATGNTTSSNASDSTAGTKGNNDNLGRPALVLDWKASSGQSDGKITLTERVQAAILSADAEDGPQLKVQRAVFAAGQSYKASLSEDVLADGAAVKLAFGGEVNANPDNGVVVSMPGATLGMQLQSRKDSPSVARLMVKGPTDTGKEAWKGVPVYVALDPRSETPATIVPALEVRFRRDENKWDLYINGMPAAKNLPLQASDGSTDLKVNLGQSSLKGLVDGVSVDAAPVEPPARSMPNHDVKAGSSASNARNGKQP